MSTLQALQGVVPMRLTFRCWGEDEPFLTGDDDPLGTAILDRYNAAYLKGEFTRWRRAGNSGDFDRSYRALILGGGGSFIVELRIRMYIPGYYTGVYINELNRCAEEKGAIALMLKPQVAAQVASKILPIPSKTSLADPRSMRQTIRDETEGHLTDAISELELSGDTGTATEKIAAHVIAETCPMPDRAVKDTFENLVEVVLQGVGDDVIHHAPALHQVSGLMRQRIKGIIAHSRYRAGSRRLMEGLWDDLREDLYRGMSAGQLHRQVAETLGRARPEALARGRDHLRYLLTTVFDAPSGMESSLHHRWKGLGADDAGAGMTIGIVGSSWDLGHKTLAHSNVRLVSGQIHPTARWSAVDTAVLSVLAARQFVGDDLDGQPVLAGFAGLLPAADYRLFSIYDSEGRYSLGRALRAAVDSLRQGDTLAVPRVLRRRIPANRSRYGELPLDASPTYCEILADAREKGIKVVMPAGKSGLDLDKLATAPAFATLGQSGADIVSVASDARNAYNAGQRITEVLPNRSIGAAGYKRLSLGPGAAFTDRWRGQYQATAVYTALTTAAQL